jgi:Salmonella virulence plasmid 65kDa B protein
MITRLVAGRRRVFHTRVEGRFRRIVRHGDGPATYWWEVTDKSGQRMVFGGAADTTLTDAHGNIASWALREARDTHDNFMRYRYAWVEDGGVASASLLGSNPLPAADHLHRPRQRRGPLLGHFRPRP